MIPVILSTLLIAAHLSRHYSNLIAFVGLILLLTLLIRKPWIPRLWQGLLSIAVVEWIITTVELVQFRWIHQEPWLRLLVILSSVILFNIFSIIWLENRKIKSYYQ
ncbi:MAG: hypothetical protein ISR95_06050 [Candidatus Marinimicrobia bacterium]|nr:hypothetical protein [Candidatus Neomarinimicrobiota bacterium]